MRGPWLFFLSPKAGISVGADLHADLPFPIPASRLAPRLAQVASPVESSPGDQAFDSSCRGPARRARHSVGPQPSPSWREPGPSRPRRLPRTSRSTERQRPDPSHPLAVTTSPCLREVHLPHGTHGASQQGPPPRGIMAKTMAQLSAATNRMVHRVQACRAKAAARKQGGGCSSSSSGRVRGEGSQPGAWHHDHAAARPQVLHAHPVADAQSDSAPRAHRPRHGQGRDPGSGSREGIDVVQGEGITQEDVAADGGEARQSAETP